MSIKPKAIDLFAGAGGLSLGFEESGFEVVLANEFDASIAGAYQYNHRDTEVVIGDITALNLEEIFAPWHNVIDVIIGGPPCQGFSMKGQRLSVKDKRNFLFKNYIEVVRLVQPKYIVMENVPELLTAENGLFRDEILELFDGIGYQLTMGTLNAMDYGVPQSRRRAFIIGKLGGQAPPLPAPCSSRTTVWDAISDLAFLESGEGSEEQTYPYPPQSAYQALMRNDSTVLYNHAATKHSPLTLERLSMIPPNAGKEVLPAEHLTKSIYSGTWTRMRADEVSATITTRFDTPSSGKFTHPFLNRAITVREAARIQSFPDTYVFRGKKASQMKQVGNAVPPLLAKAVADMIKADM